MYRSKNGTVILTPEEQRMVNRTLADYLLKHKEFWSVAEQYMDGVKLTEEKLLKLKADNADPEEKAEVAAPASATVKKKAAARKKSV